MATARVTEGNLPLILEVEDQPLVITSTLTPFLDPSDSHRPVPTTTHPREPIEGNINKEGINGGIDDIKSEHVPILGPDGPSRAIDDHALFWSTYDKVADSCDKELLDAWNKSLDVLLIFAGLFSAVNTAFIVESYKSLQPDPAETTNALLRLFIIHRNDNVTLSLEDLISPAPSAIPVNSVFFSSLSFSLTAAFGAVTAKQWLTEYANVGTMKALHIQGKRRQKKHNGLKKWHFRLIIELLPMLLQISLFLFLIGVVHFLWNIDRTVAVEQLALSAAGLAIYIVTIIIGIIVPTSPFQTPLSRHLPQFFNRIRRYPWKEWFTPVTTFINKLGVKYLQPVFMPHLSVFIRWIRNTDWHNRYKYVPEEVQIGWLQESDSPDSITAAEAVVWLLEQAEHPDVTMIALDAVLRLPPDCLMNLIQQREGLLERLIRFHKSLLPPRPALISRKEWRKTWPNRVVVSGVALGHILKSHRFGAENSELEALIEYLEVRVDAEIGEVEADPMVLMRYLVDNNLCSTKSLTLNGYWVLNRLSSSPVPLVCSPLIQVEPMDMRQGQIGSSFVPLILQHELVLDFIIRFALYSSSFDPLRLIPKSLSMMLQGELPPNLVSHVAITFATMCWSRKLDNPWSYPSEADQRGLELSLNQRRLAVDKSKYLLTNIALALSMVDVCNPDVFSDLNDPSHPKPDWTIRILISLLKIATPLLRFEFGVMCKPSIHYRNLAQSILRLSRKIDLKVKTMGHDVTRPLLHCPAGDWILPTNDEYGRDIVQLLASLLSGDPDDLTAEFLTKIARVSNEIQFREIIESPTYIYPYHRSLPFEYPYAPEFIKKVLLLPDHSSSPGPSILLETQICFTVGALHDLFMVKPVCDFLNRMVQEDRDLHWPAYFITAGVVPPSSHPNDQHPALLTFIDHEYIWRQHFAYEEDGGRKHLWRGEAILMLWIKGKKERVNGRLPSDWNDFIFFRSYAVSTMTAYFQQIRRHTYMGIDWDLVKEYFSRALDAVQEEGYDFGKTHGGYQVRQINAEQINQIVGELSEYSNDRPPPPRDRDPSSNFQELYLCVKDSGGDGVDTESEQADTQLPLEVRTTNFDADDGHV